MQETVQDLTPLEKLFEDSLCRLSQSADETFCFLCLASLPPSFILYPLLPLLFSSLLPSLVPKTSSCWSRHLPLGFETKLLSTMVNFPLSSKFSFPSSYASSTSSTPTSSGFSSRVRLVFPSLTTSNFANRLRTATVSNRASFSFSTCAKITPNDSTLNLWFRLDQL